MELCRRLHELALHWLRAGTTVVGFDYGRILNFDPTPVMELIIQDFRTSPTEFNTTDTVAEYLTQQGVPQKIASELSRDVSQMTLDVISSQLPNFTFDDLATNCILQLTANARVLGVTFLSGMEYDRKNVPKY